jgi:serine phosphatase RsbU (regulator of sigma subunit)
MTSLDDASSSSTVFRPVEQAVSPRAEARHFLVISDPEGSKRWVNIGGAPLTLGRSPPADLVVPDETASRAHCRVEVIKGTLYVSDLGSTNGTFVDGRKISARTGLKSGSAFQIGGQVIGYERRLASELEESQAIERDLQSASRYVQLLLPEPITTGPFRAEWHFLPCARVGGDAFGYGAIGDGWFSGFMFDVTGHGTSAALHAVTVLNVVRRGRLLGIDLRDPGALAAGLNNMFQANHQDVPLFSLWTFTYDVASRRLRYCSAGHHAGLLVSGPSRAVTELNTRNPLIGLMPSRGFETAECAVAPGDALYLFSDGVFEITTSAGKQWTYEELIPIIQEPPSPVLSEPQRIYQRVKSIAKPGPLPDDFSLTVLSFP